ncbi:MAG: tRNA adenosine(34) deaminase TadA [Pseudomonadales bacterium]
MTLEDADLLGRRSVDEQFMRAAFKEALFSEAAGEVPVGAVVVLNGEIIGRGHNRVVTDHDPSAHAEIVALRQAGRILENYRMPSASLYVTIEPCSMCAGALIHSRIETLVFGAAEPRAGAVCSQRRFFESEFLNHRVLVRGGVLAEASGALMQRFFSEKRGRAQGR